MAMLVVPEALQLERVGGNEAGGEEVLTAGVPNIGGGVSCCPTFPANRLGLRWPANGRY